MNQRIQHLESLYNKIIVNAPVRYFRLYLALYHHGKTQKQLAEEWGVTVSYIKKLNKKLCVYLTNQINFTKGENE